MHDDVGDNHVGDDDDDVDVDNGDDKEWKGQPRSLAEKCLHDFSLDQNLRCQFGSSEPITDWEVLETWMEKNCDFVIDGAIIAFW